MKTNTTFKPGPLSRALFPLLLGATAIWVMPATTRAEVLVSLFSENRIAAFDETTGSYLGDFVTKGSGGISAPAGLVFGPDGNLYVASDGSNSILRYNGSTGAFIDAFVPSGSGGLARPNALEFGPDGNLYVSSSVAGGGIYRFDRTTGAFLGVFVSGGSGGLQGPNAMTFGPDQNLYVGSAPDNSVLRYNGTTGAFINAFVPNGVGGLKAPYYGLTFDGLGHMLVGGFGSSNVVRYDALTGTFVDSISGGGLKGTEAVQVGPDGDLYVVSQGTQSVLRYNLSTGAFLDAFATGIGNGAVDILFTSERAGWTGVSSTSWSDSGNWSGPVPGAIIDTTNTDTAIFDRNSPNSPLTVDAGRNIQNITFDTASVNSLTIGTVGSPSLLLTAGGTIQTTSTVVNAETINAPLVLEGDYTFTSGASSSSATLSVGGRITPATTSGVTTLTLNGANTGANTISGALADNGSGQLAVTMSGPGVWIISGANDYSGGTVVLGGTLRFDITSGSATIAAGTTATVAPGATLELAGSVSAFGSAGGNRTHVLNNSTASGLLVSGTNQVVGGIDGAGNTQVNAGSSLTADHIVQNALIIGGAAGSPATVTIDASDASGNALDQSSGLALAGSLAPNDPFAAGIGSPNWLVGAADSDSSFTLPTLGGSNSAVGVAAVPEPSTILLSAFALLGLLITDIRRRTNG